MQVTNPMFWFIKARPTIVMQLKRWVNRHDKIAFGLTQNELVSHTALSGGRTEDLCKHGLE